jgi:hypothetical protein
MKSLGDRRGDQRDGSDGSLSRSQQLTINGATRTVPMETMEPCGTWRTVNIYTPPVIVNILNIIIINSRGKG